MKSEYSTSRSGEAFLLHRHHLAKGEIVIFFSLKTSNGRNEPKVRQLVQFNSALDRE